ETSGRYVDSSGLRLRLGSSGRWLVDPYNLTVVAGNGLTNNDGPTSFTPNGDDSLIGADLIAAQLDANTNVTLDTGGPAAQAGNLTISAPIAKSLNNGAGLTLVAANAVAINSAITLPGGALTVAAGGGVLFTAATMVGSNLSVTAGGAVTQTAAGVLTVAGTSTFAVGAAPIALGSSGNSFGGAVSVSNTGSNNVSLADATSLMLGTSTVGGNLAITTSGALTQSGALAVSGTSSFDTGSHSIALTNAGNDFTGAVSVSNTGSNNVSLTDANSLTLGTSTVGGNLAITSVGGAVTLGTCSVGGAFLVTGASGATVNGAISASSFLASAAGSTSFNGGSVTTTGAQIYNNAVKLPVGSTNLSGSTVTFNSTVDGASNLTVTGNASFNDQVGATTSLTSLHVTGTSDINTCLIKTTGAQIYDGAVTMLSCTILDGHPVTFNSTVNGSPIYQFVGFFSPIPNSKWKLGQTVPFKIALADMSGVRLSDSAAAALLTPICRVKISSASLSLAPTCMKYDPANDQFTFSVKLSNPGTQTVTVTLSYPGTTFTTTKSVTFTATK
ncbi:MAG TPA: hypothetical protein VGP69_08195, partial [Gaiellaceae bacterium]|nr:hypothetical protein [Gaiellaceae bacterium]